MRITRHLPVRLAWIILAALTLSVSSRAQDESSSKKPEEQGTAQTPTATQETQTDPAQAAAAPTPGYPLDAQIHPAGQAVPWIGTTSPLRWGSFSIGNFTYQQVHDNFRPQGGLPSSVLNLSILRTSLVFDKMFHKQEVVLQYEPQLAVLNGQLASNAGMDNDVVFGSAFELTPRLSLTLKDVFAQVRTRQLFPPKVLAVDEQAGNVVQNNFLQNQGSFLMNTVAGVINYKLSPRTLLTVSPMYRYANTTDKNQANYVANGHDYGTAVAVTRALTPRQNLGITYTMENLRAANVPTAANTHFNTAGLFYSYQLSKTWLFRGQIGDEIATYSGGLPTVNTLAGGATLVKSFTRSVFAIAYMRGNTQQNFITGQIGDRGDISYGIHLTRRLGWYNGGGYYRETGADPRTKGSYGASSVEFNFVGNLVVFGSYTYMFQVSSTPQLLSGTRNSVSLGLKWEPRALPVH